MTKNEGGFTILETMIVMAVTAAMLISAVTLFSGEQRKTQFAQSLRDLESKIQDVMNDTETGYFPNIGGTNCAVNSGSPVITSGGGEQGSNLDCIFLGKTMHFQENKLDIYPVIGTRTLTGTNSIVSSANPVAADILRVESNYLWGINLNEIYFGNNGASRRSDGALITIASSPNGTGFTASNNLNSGIQRINSHVSGLGGSNSISSAGATVSAINGSLQSISANSWPGPSPNNVIVLCFEDSPSGSLGRKFGGVVIGGGLQGIGTRIQVSTTGGDGFLCT